MKSLITQTITEISKLNHAKILTQLNVGDRIHISYQNVFGKDIYKHKIDGVILARNIKGISSNILIRSFILGTYVEQILFLNSPFILNITVLQQAKVSKSRLYYLRNRFGKRAKLKLRNKQVI